MTAPEALLRRLTGGVKDRAYFGVQFKLAAASGWGPYE